MPGRPDQPKAGRPTTHILPFSRGLRPGRVRQAVTEVVADPASMVFCEEAVVGIVVVMAAGLGAVIFAMASRHRGAPPIGTAPARTGQLRMQEMC